MQALHATIHNPTVTYVARGSMIVADSIVLVVTWAKTFRHWYELRRLQLDLPTSISTCLLRDGTSGTKFKRLCR